MITGRQKIDPGTPDDPENFKVNLSAQDVTRWQMAWRALVLIGFQRNGRLTWPENLPISHRGQSLNMINSSLSDFALFLGLSTAALLYGGLHALAWYAHFGSYTERILWRISACTIMSAVPAFSFLIFLNEKFVIPNGLVMIEGMLGLMILIFYFLCRAYLVVESFVNLGHLPAGAFDLPDWSAYFPHIS